MAPCRRPFAQNLCPSNIYLSPWCSLNETLAAATLVQSDVLVGPGVAGQPRGDLSQPHRTTFQLLLIDLRGCMWVKRDKDILLSCPPPPPFLLILPLCVEPRVISMWSTLSVSSRHIKLAEGGMGFSVFRIGSRLVFRYTSSSVKATPRQS